MNYQQRLLFSLHRPIRSLPDGEAFLRRYGGKQFEPHSAGLGA